MYRVYDLKCNNQTEPTGFDMAIPEFSWKLESSRQSTFQDAYRILVWLREEIVWDSGFVLSDQTNGIFYKGTALDSGEKYRWKVISRNSYGETAESGETQFVTGKMEKNDWKGKWISSGAARKPSVDSTDADAMFAGLLHSDPHPEEKLNSPVYFRRCFSTKKTVAKAVVYASAHGIYELQIDGKKISHLFAPEYTVYRKHLEYQTYNVTDYFTPGEHCIGCILADGWYTGKIGLMGIGEQYGTENSVFIQLELTFDDGEKEYIVSDENFRWNTGDYIYADLFVGEFVDQRTGKSSFTKNFCDQNEWKQVKICDFDYAMLKGQSVKPVSILRKIMPKLLRTQKNEWVLDAGENIVGFTSFDLEAKQGTEIGLEHSEILDQDGNFMQNILGQNKNQKDRCICGKNGRNTYMPAFTFHGFRYVKITGLDSVNAEDFCIHVVGSPLEKTGYFETSDWRLNQLQDNIFRSQEGNMLSIPTDCPQRERAGWTGDMQVYISTAGFNMDVNAFLQRWLLDMRLEQRADGQIPVVIPDIPSNRCISGQDGHISSAGWSDACILVPYSLFRRYGDKRILRDNFDMMCRWMDYVENETGGTYIWGQGFHYGDWLIPSILQKGGSPIDTAMVTKEEISTAMFALITERMITICDILEEQKKAEYYLHLHQKIIAAFSEKFVNEDGTLKKPLQGLYVLALSMHLIDREKEKRCVQELVNLIHTAGDHLDTGFLSVPYILDTLCLHGYKELAYKILFTETPPSWLYAVNNGATTIWENWCAILPNGVRTNSSYNHFAFGCVGDFMYRHIGGLYEETPGYKTVRIQPDFPNEISWAKTGYESVYGKISIEWKKDEKKITLQVQLPPNTDGIVNLMGKEYMIGNGNYSFQVGIA